MDKLTKPRNTKQPNVTAQKTTKRAKVSIQDVANLAERDLITFAKLISPERLYGEIHEVVYKFLMREDVPNSLILLPRGHMKALKLNQRVLTPNGWVETGNLTVGDYIYGQDGTPKQVTHLHPVSKMSLFEVETRTGRKVICNEEHLWNVICPSNTGQRVITKSLGEIRENYKSPRFDKRNGKEYTEYRYFLPNISPIDFSKKELPIDPYTLGIWLGDGTSCGGSITTADPEIFKSIPYEVTSWKDPYKYNLVGLASDLRKLNLKNNKHIPKEYLLGSLDQRLELLRGLMDSDGSAHKTENCYSFSNTNKSLINGVVDIVRSLGGVATICDAKTKVSKESEKYFHSWVVTVKLGDGLCPFKLTRKVERWEPARSLREAIVSITEVDKGLGRCITVEDHLFITEDYTLTHNSFMVAVYVTWRITKNPELTCLYLSATSSLAETQLYLIKNLLTSKTYRRYWPHMVNREEKMREKWSATAISVDHPKRKKEMVRDATIMAAGLTTNTTGSHCDLIISDDVVVPDNAYTAEGRRKTSSAMSQMASILNTGGTIKAVGTRYHPMDQYQIWKDQTMHTFNDALEVSGETKVWEIFEEAVEKEGVFLWPRAMRPDGQAFGFNIKEIARIKALYTDRTQYYAQYYNEPNDPESQMVTQDKFQYYDRKYIRRDKGKWFFKNSRLNVYAAIDFAYSLSKRADYSAIVVIGIDSSNNIYILDMDRFKTDRMEEYFSRISAMHSQWQFKKLRTEVTAAQSLISSDIKDRIREDGMRLTVVEHRPKGNKEERMCAALDHRYNNGSIWHLRGGFTPVLEEEVMLARPQHDDLKDSLTACIEIAVKPAHSKSITKDNVVQLRNRTGSFNFGGRYG